MANKFKGFSVGDWSKPEHGVARMETLNLLWPPWPVHARECGGLPPLDDPQVEHQVRMGLAPEWLIDGIQTVRRCGGMVWEIDEAKFITTALHKGVGGARDEGGYSMLVLKPRWNPAGLARGARVVRLVSFCAGEHETFPGDMAQPLYQGTHTSTDYAVSKGSVCWGIESIGHPMPGGCPFGQFTHWDVGVHTFVSPAPTVNNMVHKHLRDFTGVVNIEAIGGHPIEVHFRPSLAFFPLYGEEAVCAVLAVACGEGGRWFRSPKPPHVTGGRLLIEPKEAHKVWVKDMEEESWRERLVFIRKGYLDTD